jgi:hypothetical protein
VDEQTLNASLIVRAFIQKAVMEFPERYRYYCLCVLYVWNNQRLFPYTQLTEWFV